MARGAEVTLREIEARDRAQERALKTFVSRLAAAPAPDFEVINAIRHASRLP